MPHSKTDDKRSIQLPTGLLEISLCRDSEAIDPWLDFAARRNPRRGFLFVSTAIGRYLPAKPKLLDSAAQELVRRLPVMEGPILIVALAEAGIALGHSIHRLLSSKRTTLLLHSTRHPSRREPWIRFTEPHSHGPRHLLYSPASPQLRSLRDRARTLLLVDDELTTGRTLANLASELVPQLPQVRQVHTLTLCDWTGRQSRIGGRPAVSLIAGQYSFLRTDNRDFEEPAPISNIAVSDFLRNEGRDGIVDAIQHAAPTCLPGSRVLVLGCGEHQGGPLALARDLEQNGVDASFQCTTAAPVRVGGAIKSACSFAGPYGGQHPHYLYNFDRTAWDTVLICSETGAGTVDPRLVEHTGGVEHRWD